MPVRCDCAYHPAGTALTTCDEHCALLLPANQRPDRPPHLAAQHQTPNTELVSPAVFAKYERFKFSKEHNNARACPFCEALELGDPAHPEMSCSACGKAYCYFHSSAHVGKSCTDYELAMHEGALHGIAFQCGCHM